MKLKVIQPNLNIFYEIPLTKYSFSIKNNQQELSTYKFELKAVTSNPAFLNIEDYKI